MIKPELLLAALIAAAVLVTPAAARQSKMTSQRVAANANAHAATDTHNAYGHACCRNRAGDSRGLVERDVWGHWGAYYGPMIH
jgi:Ni/Co efflux regulator RcnB